MKRFLTVHLVFHDQHLPENLKSMKWKNLRDRKKCRLNPVFHNTSWNATHWHRRRLKYPTNLLRNVARLNIFTYYVLSVDIQMLPTKNFPEKFLEFVWNHNTWRFVVVPDPYTTFV